MEACELLAIETRLDRIEAELAVELPPHLRAFARAHARGEPAPPAPDALQRPAALATARAALVHPVLADRGLALLRLAAPVAIEADPAVAAARSAAPAWAGLAALAAARDAAAMARFGRRAIDVLHRLHGSTVDLASLCVGVRAAGSAAGRATQDAGPAIAEAGPGRDPVESISLVAQRAVSAVRSRGDEPGGVAPAARAALLQAAAGHEPTGSRVPVGALHPGSGAGGHCDAERDQAVPATGAAVWQGDGADATRTDGGTARAGRDLDDTVGLPPAIPGWFEPDGVAVDERAIVRAWDQLRAGHGVDGALRYERVAGARPRAFVIEPGREVVLAIPADVATPAGRFAVLHELGHAVAALALPAGLPRVVDEAAAAYVARAIERAADPWFSPLAGAARTRRRRLAQVLDRIERALPALPAAPAISERAPWSLWHDPGAQAAYVAAEWLADAIEQAIGASPGQGALAAALAAWAAPIDRLGTATYAI